MSINLASAQAKLQEWLDAESALSRSQSYTRGDISVTRADIATVRNQITYWKREVANLTNPDNSSMAAVAKFS